MRGAWAREVRLHRVRVPTGIHSFHERGVWFDRSRPHGPDTM